MTQGRSALDPMSLVQVQVDGIPVRARPDREALRFMATLRRSMLDLAKHVNGFTSTVFRYVRDLTRTSSEVHGDTRVDHARPVITKLRFMATLMWSMLDHSTWALRFMATH